MTTQLNVNTIKQGSYSSVGSRKEVAVTSNLDWTLLWNQHHARVTPAPALPGVDFSKEMVIAVYSGTKSSGGHSITVEKVEDDGTQVIVTYREKGPSGMATMAMTQPFHLVTIPATTKPIVYQKAK